MTFENLKEKYTEFNFTCDQMNIVNNISEFFGLRTAFVLVLAASPDGSVILRNSELLEFN